MTEALVVVLIVVGYVLVLCVGFLAVLAFMNLAGPLIERYEVWLTSIAKRWSR